MNDAAGRDGEPAAGLPAAEQTREIEVTVNGVARRVRVPTRTLLSDLVRHDLGLTGTHVGCEQGVCGACTVLVGGRAVRSCLMLAVQAHGHEVETVESLAAGGGLSALQEAMRAEHALQCGFCTPGILMSLVAARRATPGGAADAPPGEDSGGPPGEVSGGPSGAADGLPAEVSDALSGHLCRCTGYQNIRAAIRRAWQEVPGRDAPDRDVPASGLPEPAAASAVPSARRRHDGVSDQ
jgi:aerobic-type carbon monoxide dehydrogenase small subunit (CoxS/CutS family)